MSQQAAARRATPSSKPAGDVRPSAEAIRALLRPRSIAILGASPREGSLGQRLLTHITGWRYRRAIYPINPGYKEINGLPCFASFADLPERVDLVAYAVGDDKVEDAFAQATQSGAKAGVILGRLYEAEPPHPTRLERLARTARDNDVALQGGNCMGFINFFEGLRVSGNPPPTEGEGGCVSIISHSGSTWSGLVGSQRDLPLGYAISAGQELGVTMADYIDFLVDEGSTRAIGLIVETIRDPESFVAAAQRASQKGVALAALKLGRSALGQRFALSHSGALSGQPAIYDAVFRRNHIASCRTLDELTDTLEIFTCTRKPPRGSLGATTDSGAERQLVVDLAEEIGCPLATLSKETEKHLTAILDPGMLPENPVDVYGDGKFVLAECLETVAKDDDVAIVAMVSNLVEGRPRLMGMVKDAMKHTLAATEKPLVSLANIHSTVSRQAAKEFRDQNIPVLMSTATGLHAIKHYLRWHARGVAAPQIQASANAAPAEQWRRRLAKGRLSPEEGLQLFADFGGEIAGSRAVSSAEQAVRAAKEAGYPVALKTANPDIAHKTEAGGVVLDLASADAVTTAYDAISLACGPLVQVQHQVPRGVEVFLGMVRDPDFGPVVTFGTGGLFVEVLKDTITVIPPASPEEILSLLTQLRGYPLLQGARGLPRVNVEQLAISIANFTKLAATLGDEIVEYDLNPLIAGPSGAVAVDALVVTRSDRPS